MQAECGDVCGGVQTGVGDVALWGVQTCVFMGCEDVDRFAGADMCSGGCGFGGVWTGVGCRGCGQVSWGCRGEDRCAGGVDMCSAGCRGCRRGREYFILSEARDTGCLSGQRRGCTALYISQRDLQNLCTPAVPDHPSKGRYPTV